MVTAAEKTQKPSLPADDMGQTAAAMSALASAKGPLGASTLAMSFRQGKRVEPKVQAVLMALARVGFIATSDGGRSFNLRHVA